MSTFLKVTNAANNFILSPDSFPHLPLLCDDIKIGTIPLQVVKKLPASIFEITKSAIRFHACTEEERTRQMAQLLKTWRENDEFPCLRKWRDEIYPVYGRDSRGTTTLVFRLERSAYGLFGVRAYGCHLNGYVVKSTGEYLVWIAKRSENKQTFPSQLDNLVGGGLPYGIKPFENLLKESQEEAGIPVELASKSTLTGFISTYSWHEENGISPETEFVYDLMLPEDFIPIPQDGEVEYFKLCTLQEVKSLLLNLEFTPEASVVMLDFLVRHGFITPESDSEYLKLVETLRSTIGLPPMP